METATTNSATLEADDITVVIDNGSGMMKAGFSGDDAPRAVFPSVVGRPRHKGVMVGMNQHDVYVGDESVAKRGILSQKWPIEGGIVQNWDDMEKIWHHTFYNELRIDPEDNTILLTESVFNPKQNREKMIQIMFETFNTPAFYLANQANLGLFAQGKINGVIVESGYKMTHIVPCYEGVTLAHAVYKLDLGGETMSDYLVQLLNETGHFITNTSSERAIVDDIKKTLAFIAMDYDKALKAEEIKPMQQEYELPDGQMLSLGSELFRCAEVLFNPKLIGLEQEGIHHGLCNAIKKCDIEIQSELFETIVFSGGNTMIKGIDERLLKEVNGLVCNKMLINGYLRQKYLKQTAKQKPLYQDIVDLLNRYTSFQPKFDLQKRESRVYFPWIGGSILASLSTFKDVCVTRDEYNESGPSVVHRKCVW